MLTNSAERRRSARVSPRGTAVVHRAELSATARILDVCDGGLRLQADYLPELAPWADADVMVDLQVEGRRWVSVAGRVVRIEPNFGVLAIRLEQTPLEFRDLVTQEVLADVERDLAPFIVLVDAAPERRVPIADAFRRAGSHVVEAATPYEALMRLSESDEAPEIIAIADSVSEAIAEELRELIMRAQEHGDVRLVN